MMKNFNEILREANRESEMTDFQKHLVKQQHEYIDYKNEMGEDYDLNEIWETQAEQFGISVHEAYEAWQAEMDQQGPTTLDDDFKMSDHYMSK
jgi:hypothetical protein